MVYIAKKFDNTGVGVEDLISIGTIGLIKAINSYNPEKNIKLATYASRCIENEILMYLRRNSKTKAEVSNDEPLNVDWDGNELLLSDILCHPDLIAVRLSGKAGGHGLFDPCTGKVPCRQITGKLCMVRLCAGCDKLSQVKLHSTPLKGCFVSIAPKPTFVNTKTARKPKKF